MDLDLPVVGLVTTGEVSGSVRVTLEGPEHPVEDGLAEGATVFVAESTTMADGNIALP